MRRFFVKPLTAWSLGAANLFRVLIYRLGLKLNLNPIFRLKGKIPKGEFFLPPSAFSRNLISSDSWLEKGLLFGHLSYPLREVPPNWHQNPLTGEVMQGMERNWWQIPDFDPLVGDVKLIWDASRFDWVLSFAQRVKHGDLALLERLNIWLADWCEKNPPYCGANWKCGQEASIRVMHLAMAIVIIDSPARVSQTLLELVKLHLNRIAPTLSYAIAQDNNHGTSEAAALYIGGSLLARSGVENGAKWQRLGRRWLENRASRLIGRDGSFSQYSVTYHRVLLDTFCMVEVWRRRTNDAAFSRAWYSRTALASEWLRTMTRGENGDAPNLGANDGARLLPLTDTDYRDFRPTVQMASCLFQGLRAYPSGVWDYQLRWLGLEEAEQEATIPQSRTFDDGGFAVLLAGEAMAVMRYPRFRFRPSQADALHVDLWLGGTNLLRDAGSYSYNTNAPWQEYFPGTHAHNTVQFDGRDQMPRISRFLFGRWLKTHSLRPLETTHGSVSFSAGYKDGEKATHLRSVELNADHLKVVDEVSGFKTSAVLRWRLAPGVWWNEGCSFTNGDHRISVSASVAIERLEIVEGWESRYYLEKVKSPILELEVTQPGSFTTEYRWGL
jgi:hypothetical protein